MSAATITGDLVILTADKNIQFAVEGLLSQPERFGVRPLRNPKYLDDFPRDGGCRVRAPDYLRPYIRSHTHALVMFDWEGCGEDTVLRRRKAKLPEMVETETRILLEKNGWKDRAEVIILVPEIDIWMWNGSPKLDRIIGWKEDIPDLRTWVQEQNYPLRADLNKPERPKEVLQAALRLVREPWSSALFRQMGTQIERKYLMHCQEPAFVKFRTTLQRWFPLEAKKND